MCTCAVTREPGKVAGEHPISLPMWEPLSPQATYLIRVQANLKSPVLIELAIVGVIMCTDYLIMAHTNTQPVNVHTNIIILHVLIQRLQFLATLKPTITVV